MAGLKTLLGLYPKTDAYEGKRKQLANEFAALSEFETSDELARYKELEQFVGSGEFASQRKDLLTLQYKNSEEYKKESEFLKLKSDKEIKLYFKTKNSPLLKLYYEIHDSKKLSRFKELENYIKSEEYLKIKKYYSQSGSTRFSQSEAGKTLADFLARQKSEKIKAYQKIASNKLLNNYLSVQKSDKPARFEELKKIIGSAQFSSKKSSMKKADFIASEEGIQFAEYLSLSKSKEIKNYYKLASSPNLSIYNQMNDSGEYEAFLELKKHIESPAFKQQRLEIERKTFKDSPEYKLEAEYKQLGNDTELKKYFSFAKSKELQNYNAIHESAKLEKYNTLKEYTEGHAFAEKKKYLTMSPKLRWKQSEPYARLVEFEQLKNSEKIRWYFKFRDHKKFAWFRTWQTTFEDDFDLGKLDRNKWITRYYWGEELLNESYSLFHEKHCITDGKNLEFNGSNLRIITKKENVEGKIWDPEMGFVPHDFNYSSGLINTGKSFRQSKGLFEAKIKLANNPNILNAFWMVGENMMPHIDIVNAQHKCGFGVITGENNFTKTAGRSRFSNDFYIYSMEWDSNQISWKINGLEVATMKGNIPQDEMYVSLNAGLYTDLEMGLPASMEIDWIRCYSRKN